MKQRIIILFFVSILFLIGFDVGRNKPLHRVKWLIPQKHETVNNRLKAKFVDRIDPLIDYPVTEYKFFVVVIPSYNNEKWCEKNLISVFEQTYDYYRVIYVDDQSTDDTYSKIKSVVEDYQMQHKVTLIKNEKRIGAMANLYHMIQSCDSHEIIVSLDGDDWFAHKNVLSELNKVYANPDVWLTYGQNITYPHYDHKLCKPFDRKYLLQYGYRNHPWVTSQLRTFYAWLFKKIDYKDLMMDDEFFKVGCDFAYMFPILEMSGGRYRFIQEVYYIYNQDTPINDYKIRRQELETVWSYLQSLPPYEPIDRAPYLSY